MSATAPRGSTMCAMRRARLSGAALLLPAARFACAATSGAVSVGDSYELTAQVVGAGATTLSGANGYVTDVLVGQNNTATLSGANGYSATTGFWTVAVRGGASDRVFVGTFESPAP